MSAYPQTPDLQGQSSNTPRSVERFPNSHESTGNQDMDQILSPSTSSLRTGSITMRSSVTHFGDSQMNTLESLKLETERKERLLAKLNAQLQEREEQHDRDTAALSEMQDLLEKKEEQISELTLAISQRLELQADNALTESLNLHGWDISEPGAATGKSGMHDGSLSLSNTLSRLGSTIHTDQKRSSVGADTDALRQSISNLQAQLSQREQLQRDTEISNQQYREEIKQLKDENSQYQALITSQTDEIMALKEQQTGETEELAALEEELSVLRTTLAEKLQIIETLTADAQFSKSQLVQMKDAQRLVQYSADVATAEIETATEEITTLRMQLDAEKQKALEIQAELDHERFASKQKTHEYTEVLTSLSHSRGIVSSLEAQLRDMELNIKIKDEEIEALQLKCKSLQIELDDAHAQMEQFKAGYTPEPNLSADELATILSDNNNMLNMLTESAAETETLVAANERLQTTNKELTRFNAELVEKIEQLSMGGADAQGMAQSKSQLLETKTRIIGELELDISSLKQKYSMMEKSLNDQLESVTIAKVTLEAENTRLRSELQNMEPPAMSSMTSATSISIAGTHSPTHSSNMSVQIMNLNSEILQLQAELRRKDAELDNVSTQITTIMEEVVSARQSNMALEQTVQALTQELDFYKNQGAALEKTLTQAREELRITLDKTRVGELIEALNGKTTEVTKLIRVIEDKNVQIKEMQIELDGRSMSSNTNIMMQSTIKNLEEEILRLNQELELVMISNESLENRLHSMGSSIIQTQPIASTRNSANMFAVVGNNSGGNSERHPVSTTIKMRQLSAEVITLKETISNLTAALKQKDARLEEVTSELATKHMELDNMRTLIKKKNEQLMQFMK